MPTRFGSWSGAVRARTPLRVKLVAAVLVLVIAALGGSGIAAAVTLRSYLVGRVDAQLRSVEQPLAEHHGQGGGRGGDGDKPDGDLFSDYVTATADVTGRIVAGPTSNFVDPGRPLPRLPHVAGTRQSHFVTVAAERGDEQWRVLIAPVTLADGSPGSVLIAQSLGNVDNTVNHLLVLLLVIGGVAVTVIAGLGYLVVRTSLRPLRDVERTAAKIAAGDLAQRVHTGDPRTEVGQLAGALNTMLADIETAFAERSASEAAAQRSEERMRRFVADASHELRTPLTSIRGFAELYRQGAAPGEQDVERLMRRIEDAATRMGLLVEDLLLLARLDQERPLAQAPVDLLALAADAVHDATVVDPDRPITLQVGSTDPLPVVTGDESRLRQILANLLTNARTHTPPSSPVTVHVGTVGADVVLEVADTGPGMNAEHAAHVFERFYRADPARSHGGSTGLGLAIVAALVAGHHGTVGVTTAPGAGARFRVTLPLAAAPAVAG